MTIVFYQKDATVYAVQYQTSENSLDVSKLEWLFSGAHKIQGDALKGYFIGPRREMITPWSRDYAEYGDRGDSPDRGIYTDGL